MNDDDVIENNDVIEVNFIKNKNIFRGKGLPPIAQFFRYIFRNNLF